MIYINGFKQPTQAQILSSLKKKYSAMSEEEKKSEAGVRLRDRIFDLGN